MINPNSFQLFFFSTFQFNSIHLFHYAIKDLVLYKRTNWLFFLKIKLNLQRNFEKDRNCIY